MKKNNLKILVSVTTFLVGVFVFTFFTYRALNTEVVNNQFAQPVEFKQSEQSIISEEEKIYTAVLNELFLKGNTEVLAISDTTMFYSDSKYLKENSVEQRIQSMKKSYDSAEDDTLRDYEFKMHTSSKLNFNFEIPVKYVFVNKEEISKGKEGGITAFFKKNNGAEGMIEFSAVGFNAEKTQAFVSVDFIYCPLCGFGSSLLLEKVDGNWKIVKNYEGWVS